MSKSKKIAELEEKLRQNQAGLFIDAVDRDDADTIILSLSAFYGEPDLLYTALEYASYHDRTVTVAPMINEDLEK